MKTPQYNLQPGPNPPVPASGQSNNHNQDETRQFVPSSVFKDRQQQIPDNPSAMDTVANTTTPQVEAQAQPEVDKTAELVKSLYSIAPPTPKLDQDRLDRIQKMGRLNTLGRGVGVIGNIFSSAMGANVRKAAPDTVTPRLLAEYQNTLDRHKYDQDVYDKMDYQNKKEGGRFAIAFQQRKEALDLENKKIEYANKLANAKTEADREKWGLIYEQNERKIESLQKNTDKKVNETIRHNKAIESKNGGSGKSDLPTSILTSSGKTYNLSPSEFSLLTNEATGNEEIYNHPKFGKWFDRVEITKQVPNARFGGFDKVPTGQFTYKLKSTADKHALSQAMLELYEEGIIALPGKRGQTKQSKNSPEWSPRQQGSAQPEPPHNQPTGTVTGPSKEEMARNAAQQQAPDPVAPAKKIDWSTKGKRTTQSSTNKIAPSMFQNKQDNFGHDNAAKKQTGGLY